MQQAESSASRMHSAVPKAGCAAHQGREASVHTSPGGKGMVAAADDTRAPSVHDRIKRTPANERLHDTRGHTGDGDARNIINGRMYTPRRGGRFDPEHDRGLSPEPPGTRVFSREIRTAPFPHAFDSPPPSSSTQERPTPRSGSTTTAWHASWVVQRTTP